MTLADLTLPLAYEMAVDLALVFGGPIAARLAEIQEQHGSPSLHVSPVRLTDGRWMCCADLLSEVGPGGLLAEGFSHLDRSRLAEIEVVPMSVAVALIPRLPEAPVDA
jgi:hypothetical protein